MKKRLISMGVVMIVIFGVCAAFAYIPARPPEPPVPFAYDPNRVNYEIIEAIRHYPGGGEFHFARKITEPDGQEPVITFSDPGIWVSAPVVSIDPDDPNGVSRIYEYVCGFPVARPPGLYYVDIVASDNDPNEPMEDRRTMIIMLWPKNRPPVIK